MSTRLVTLCFDANDPLRLARFWADTLHWDVEDEDRRRDRPRPDGRNALRRSCSFPFRSRRPARTGSISISSANRPSTNPRWSIGSSHRVRGTSTSGNRPTMITSCWPTPRATSSASSYAATSWRPPVCSARSCSSPRIPIVGRFWSEATGWPIVFDEDGDTAIRAPDGQGPFVTFGPPTGRGEDGEEPAASRHRTAGRRRPGCGSRASHRARSPPHRHRPRRRLVGRARRPRRQRVLRADASLRRRRDALPYAGSGRSTVRGSCRADRGIARGPGRGCRHGSSRRRDRRR